MPPVIRVAFVDSVGARLTQLPRCALRARIGGRLSRGIRSAPWRRLDGCRIPVMFKLAPVADHSQPTTSAAPRLLIVDNQVKDFLQHRMVLACKLRESGFDVHVAVPQEPGLEEISRQGLSVHTIYLRRFSTKPLDELRCLVSLIRLYRRLRPALVHHICLKPALYGGLAARIAGVPAVVATLTGLGHVFTTRTAKGRLLRSMVAGGLRLSFSHQNHCVIIQNRGDRDCLVANAIERGDHAVVIKGSGVDLASFVPRPELEGVPVVLMASRLLWEKGVGEFVVAARRLRARGIAARFVLVGEPDHGHPSAVPLSTLEHWCETGDVEWLGWRDDISALLARSHIVCLPTVLRRRHSKDSHRSGRLWGARSSPPILRAVVRSSIMVRTACWFQCVIAMP